MDHASKPLAAPGISVQKFDAPQISPCGIYAVLRICLIESHKLRSQFDLRGLPFSSPALDFYAEICAYSASFTAKSSRHQASTKEKPAF